MNTFRASILSDNNLIAKFLGWYQEDDQPDTWYKKEAHSINVVYSLYKDVFKELPFHKDWNYLINVYNEVILRLQEINTTKSKVVLDELGFHFSSVIAENKIRIAWEFVVDAIKFYFDNVEFTLSTGIKHEDGTEVKTGDVVDVDARILGVSDKERQIKMMPIAKAAFEKFPDCDTLFFTDDLKYSSLIENAQFRASKLGNKKITPITRLQVKEWTDIVNAIEKTELILLPIDGERQQKPINSSKIEKLTQNMVAAYMGNYIEIHFENNRIPDEFKKADKCLLNLGTFGECMGWLHQRHKLMLTPISEILDEHVIELAKMRHKNEFVDFQVLDIKRFESAIGIEYRFKSSIAKLNLEDGYRYSGTGIEFNRDKFTVEQIDYLRSLGYDCGYGDIVSLIESGLAVVNTNK